MVKDKTKIQLKIKFVDFWGGFNPTNNSFWNELIKYYDLVLSDEPEVLFYSVFGKEYLKYSCYRVFYTGENIRPNFSEFDLAISFDYNTHPKNIRLPLYTRLYDLTQLKAEIKSSNKFPEKTKFCCMLVSNPDCDFRNQFFEQLSNYKKVDSGGKYANNIGYAVPDKMDFIKDYKFVVSFENSEYDGYTTEKIVEPMLCGSIPIYWGNPLVNKEFDTGSFVNIYDFDSVEEAIERIIEIDKNNKLFEQIQMKSNLIDNKLLEFQDLEKVSYKIKNFIDNRFNKKPVALRLINNKYIRKIKNSKNTLKLQYGILIRRIKKLMAFINTLLFFVVNFHKDKTILIGVPTYTNIGDTAIAEASRIWIKNNFNTYKYFEISEKYVFFLIPLLKKIIRINDVVFLQGGGNMGNRYEGAEHFRTKVVENFKNNKIIVMPVTIFFDEPYNTNTQLELSSTIYNAHKDLTILLRDEKSFEFSKTYFNSIKSISIPDIVCSFPIYRKFKLKDRNNSILLSKRKDMEMKSNEFEILSVLKDLNCSYVWQDSELSNNKNEIIKKSSFVNKREQLNDFYSLLELFSIYKMVITDRYHGLIFSYITKTPCIVLDSSDHKISEGIKWFDDCEYIFYVGSDISKLQLNINKAFNFVFEDRPSGYKRATEEYITLIDKIDN